jgi:hypothetical protein
MEVVSQIKNIIQSLPSDFSVLQNWYCLRLEQPIVDPTENGGIIKSWKALNSSQSIGISNRRYLRRYIRDGYWIRIRKTNSDVMLVFYVSNKSDHLKSSLIKHLMIRFRKATGRQFVPIITLDTVKPTDNLDVFGVMDEIIETELDSCFDVDTGLIPTGLKSSRFGLFYGNNVQAQHPE